MAILGQIEKRSWKAKLLNLGMHLLLILGALTMVYPLLLMISGSVKSTVDFAHFSLIPSYLHDDEALFRKYIYTKYNGTPGYAFELFKTPGIAIEHLKKPDPCPARSVADYREFLEKQTDLPDWHYGIGMVSENGVYPFALRDFRAFLQKKFGGGKDALTRLNHAWQTDYSSWDSISPASENLLQRSAGATSENGLRQAMIEYKRTKNENRELTMIRFEPDWMPAIRRKYGPDLNAVNRSLGTDYRNWADILLPASCPENPRLAAVWNAYLREDLNPMFLILDSAAAFPEWQKFLQEKYGSAEDLNRVYRTACSSLTGVGLPELVPPSGAIRTDWLDFVALHAPAQSLRVRTLTGMYQNFLSRKYQTIDALNRAYSRTVPSFESMALSPEDPGDRDLAESRLWRRFAQSLPPEQIELARNASQRYKEFLAERYTPADGTTDFDALSADYGVRVRSVADIPVHVKFPADLRRYPEKARADYCAAISSGKFTDAFRLPVTPVLQSAWVDFLKREFADSLPALNRALNRNYTEFKQIAMPVKAYEWELMLKHRGFLIGEYLKRNYLMVFDTLFTNGSAAVNTLIYCLLAVLTSLIVNPLCAYGLSRFKPACSYKVLLFVMLPMAFPPMVLGIPQFLLIRNCGLLNTFAALILPSMASGYSIFLLKGFFDSLPKELFEAAAIDGAGEWRIFWEVAMRLSTPILSVLALTAFTTAYANFMMAFLLCQEESMWTMMVYLYQLQMRSSQAVGFAALIVAAVPTLLVFIFCQNIIIKGIVVPSEK